MENQAWYEEDSDETNLSSEGRSIVEYDITISPRDLTPSNIVEMIDSGIIEIPFFQRQYIWSIDKASKLIESLILGLPVPELFFYSEGDENDTYKVIDGQQRLLSIYFFVKGRFPKTSNSNSRLLIRENINYDAGNLSDLLQSDKMFNNFSLKLENSRYHDEKFTTLGKETQIKFKLRRYLRTVVVRQNKPDDDSSMFEIFNRLNTGGEKLTDQEIRASLYYCAFYDMLTEINENEKWRQLVAKEHQDLHSKDVEFILRAFAILEANENYAPKMRNFLNNYSKQTMFYNFERIKYLKELFISFLDSCSNLPDKAFYRNNRFSISLFDSVFAATCSNVYKKKSLLSSKIDKESFYLLIKDGVFTELMQSETASRKNVENRLLRAKEIIKLEDK